MRGVLRASLAIGFNFTSDAAPRPVSVLVLWRDDSIKTVRIAIHSVDPLLSFLLLDVFRGSHPDSGSSLHAPEVPQSTNMRYALRLAAALIAASASMALPIKRWSTIEFADSVILNFALTLEHLEVAFYKEGLALFDEAAFEAAGLSSAIRGRFVQISENEQTHARFLSEIIGPNATQPCTYSFPLTDVLSFVTLSATFEGVGTAAYTGAANLLSDPTHVVEAASILATEARQAAWVVSAVKKQNPWSTSFETPLDLNQAFSLASGFITSCPATNPSLPVRAFPALNVTSTTYHAGENIKLSFDRTAAGAASTNEDTPLFLTLLTGLNKLFAPLWSNGDGTWSATLPETLQGTVYALVTNSSGTTSDADTVAGMAILLFPFNSQAIENV